MNGETGWYRTGRMGRAEPDGTRLGRVPPGAAGKAR